MKKKEIKNIYTGLSFAFILYLLGAIDFNNIFSYPVILAIGIMIGFPIFNILRNVFKKSP